MICVDWPARSPQFLPRRATSLTFFILSAALTGCVSKQDVAHHGFSPSEYGAASPRVVEPGQPVPRGGGVYRVGQAYTVRGRTYQPREDPTLDEVGVASWYGEDFHGRRTSNGEIYDMHGFSAAHRTLPMPSYVRVTNLTNGRSVVVRVNDRGPFAHDRVIDVSKRTAQVLDFKGTVRVRVTYVGRAPLDGNDDWLVTTAQQNGRAIPPTQVAQIAPVPAWDQRRPQQPSAVQLALGDTLAPLPVERPREQPVQLASLAPPATVAPPAQPAPVASSPAAPRQDNFQQTVTAALASSPSTGTDAPAPPRPAPIVASGAPMALAAAASPAPQTPAGTPIVTASAPAPPPPPGAPVNLHVGSFRDASQAFRIRDALAKYGTAVVDPVNVSGITFYQVRVGPFRDQHLAEEALRDAQAQGAISPRLVGL